MRLGFPAAAGLVLGALFLACSPDPFRENYESPRSPSVFRADTTLSEHPFCEGNNPFGSAEACRKERKYRLTWDRPFDTVNLKGYRIYLDTAPEDKRWNTVKGRPELAAVILDRFLPKDSVVFAFTSAAKSAPDTLGKGENRILLLDSNGRAELGSGNLMFALVPVYGGGVTPGQPQFSFFVTTDRQPPTVFHPAFRPLPHGFSLAWERPTDQVSFFDPSKDTGTIAGYGLKVILTGKMTNERRKAFNPKLISYRLGGADTSALVDTLILNKEGLPDAKRFFLPDGRRASKRTRPDVTDSLYLEIGNLLPQDTLNFQIYALDSAGNSNEPNMESVSLRTTDTTQPSMPELSIDSVGKNGFTIVWSASRDSVAGPGGTLIEAGSANANIKEYRVTRIFARDSSQKPTSLDRFDTTVQVADTTRERSLFRMPVRFLPPGASYRLSIVAEDSSGYPSRIDTLTVTTLKVAFADSDSVLTCPRGFIPVPRGTFQLGDKNGTADEKPVRSVAMAPFCIEAYEHRDSTGQRFVSNVTYEQAEAMCRGIDSLQYDTRLCSEAEWERACEGAYPDTLLHGIQSEGRDPSILQLSCNQATNDSAMAMNFGLRNPVCLTTEGVYDMAGNLSEWVRDSYAAGAYGALTGDTLHLSHASVLADSGKSSVHTIRGGNYLNPELSQQTATQSLARCSNRDYPEQVRPKFREDCKSKDKPMLAIVYGPGLNGFRCMDWNREYPMEEVTELVPAARDTFAILAFRRGLPKPDTVKFDTQPFARDSALKGRKPLSAQFTKRSLAAVVFERAVPSADTGSYPDFLDATEFRDTTQAGLGLILRREAPNAGWTVRKQDGRYAIEYYYAYTVMGSKPALPYYSSRVIGFRCCSEARKPVAPTDSIVSIP